jgi:broad specificity phosphatase PhoE
MIKTIVSTALAVLLTTGQAVAQQTVFLVRHAERADSGAGVATTSMTMGADPDLSEAGRARAESLAAMLKDATLTAIIATEYKRTQQTAAPLAKALGVTVTTIKANEPAEVIKAVKAATGNVLIVGHSNTMPDIIKALGAPPPAAIADNEYDNLFVLTVGTTTTTLRLHYK